MSKTAADNYLSWSDIKLIYLLEKRVGQLPYKILDASQSEGIDEGSFKYLFDREADIQKSFCHYYLPYWFRGHSCHPRIRMCPECAKLGKHLLVHQLSFFSCCPLHRRKLIDSCLNCSRPNNSFNIEVGHKVNDDIYNCFLCPYCRYENLNFQTPNIKATRLFQKKLYVFLGDYQVWISSVNNKFRTYFWNTMPNNLDSLHLVLQVVPIDYRLERKIHYAYDYFPCEIDINLKNKLATEDEDSNYFLKNRIRIQKLTAHILQFSKALLESIAMSFGVTTKVYGEMIKLKHLYNHDAIWCEDYSVWASTYHEVSRLINYRYLRPAYLDDYLESHYWLIRMWYRDFAKPIFDKFEVRDDLDYSNLLILSKLWSRKFIYQLFCDETFEQSKSLLGLNQMSEEYCFLKTHSFNESYTPLIVICDFNRKRQKISLWRQGSPIDMLRSLYKNGYTGYNTKKQKCYTNYKMLHKTFRLSGKPLNKYDYLMSLEIKSPK